MPRRSLLLNLHPRYRATWHVPTSEAVRRRVRARGRWQGTGIGVLLILTLVGGARAGFDPGAALAMAGGGMVAVLARLRWAVISGHHSDERLRGRVGSRAAVLVLLMLGTGLAFAGLGRELLVRQARAECLDALQGAAAVQREAVRLREPYTGLLGGLIYQQGPRRCADLVRAPVDRAR